jgi:hypothetical protein
MEAIARHQENRDRTVPETEKLRTKENGHFLWTLGNVLEKLCKKIVTICQEFKATANEGPVFASCKQIWFSMVLKILSAGFAGFSTFGFN